MYDRPLEKPCSDVGFELVSPLSENETLVTHHYSLFIADVLELNLPLVLCAQELKELEQSPLIALAYLLLQILDVFLKESCVCSGRRPSEHLYSPAGQLSSTGFLASQSSAATRLLVSLSSPC